MNTIKVSDEHLQLIQKALELYMRCSIGQFDKMTDIVSSLQDWYWKQDEEDQYYWDRRLKACNHDYTGIENGSYGVGNPNLDSDVQDTMNIHDQIRHHLWKKKGEPKKGLVMEYDAMKKLIEIE